MSCCCCRVAGTRPEHVYKAPHEATAVQRRNSCVARACASSTSSQSILSSSAKDCESEWIPFRDLTTASAASAVQTVVPFVTAARRVNEAGLPHDRAATSVSVARPSPVLAGRPRFISNNVASSSKSTAHHQQAGVACVRRQATRQLGGPVSTHGAHRRDRQRICKAQAVRHTGKADAQLPRPRCGLELTH